MRWPWHRRATAGDAEPVAVFAPGTARAGGGVRADAAPACTPPPPRPSGWAFHAPLQRTILTDMGIHNGTAEGWTATGRAPGFTGAMSHLVSPASPSGVVDGDGAGVGPGSGTPQHVGAPVVPPRAPVAGGWRSAPGPTTTETGPGGGALTRAAGSPGVPVLRYAVEPMPLSTAAGPNGETPGDIGLEQGGGPVDLPSFDPPLPVAGTVPDATGGWQNPAAQDGTVVEIPLPGGRPVEPPAPPPVQRGQTSPRRLGLGAPLPVADVPTTSHRNSGAPAAPVVSRAASPPKVGDAARASQSAPQSRSGDSASPAAPASPSERPAPRPPASPPAPPASPPAPPSAARPVDPAPGPAPAVQRQAAAPGPPTPPVGEAAPAPVDVPGTSGGSDVSDTGETRDAPDAAGAPGAPDAAAAAAPASGTGPSGRTALLGTPAVPAEGAGTTGPPRLPDRAELPLVVAASFTGPPPRDPGAEPRSGDPSGPAVQRHTGTLADGATTPDPPAGAGRVTSGRTAGAGARALPTRPAGESAGTRPERGSTWRSAPVQRGRTDSVGAPAGVPRAPSSPVVRAVPPHQGGAPSATSPGPRRASGPPDRPPATSYPSPGTSDRPPGRSDPPPGAADQPFGTSHQTQVAPLQRAGAGSALPVVTSIRPAEAATSSTQRDHDGPGSTTVDGGLSEDAGAIRQREVAGTGARIGALLPDLTTGQGTPANDHPVQRSVDHLPAHSPRESSGSSSPIPAQTSAGAGETGSSAVTSADPADLSVPMVGSGAADAGVPPFTSSPTGGVGAAATGSVPSHAGDGRRIGGPAVGPAVRAALPVARIVSTPAVASTVTPLPWRTITPARRGTEPLAVARAVRGEAPPTLTATLPARADSPPTLTATLAARADRASVLTVLDAAAQPREAPQAATATLPTVQGDVVPGAADRGASVRELLAGHRRRPRAVRLPLEQSTAEPEHVITAPEGDVPPESPPPPPEEAGTSDHVRAEPAPEPIATSGAPALGPEELAGLADALYPPLLRRMRDEILLDRERRGVRTDRR